MTAVMMFAGGIGLFLLGMRLMTDGLKVAAGGALRTVLASATRSRLRGLASGVLITTMVQSSSAVIFATVGFVNAGLLTLYQAIGVIYGANLGTTLTSWVVALVGFNVNLQALAMPALGVGMGLWVAFGARRKGALGQALAGFGLFFLGIDVLRDAFDGLGEQVVLAEFVGTGPLALLAFTFIGMLLTVLMQSSSAALAVTLTAAAGGVIPLTSAAAMVIGANVGTTSTAAFAVLGATAPAKRAATAHVVFNVITAVVAFTVLPALLWLVNVVGDLMRLDPRPATSLAIFHTMTKLLGVMLMWPLTGWLVSWLQRRFRSVEEDDARPHFLDSNVQSMPLLALDALRQELVRMAGLTHRLAAEALSREHPDAGAYASSVQTLESLQDSIGEFASGIDRARDDPLLSVALPHALRVAQYHVNSAEQAVEVARLHGQVELSDAEVAAQVNALRGHVVALLDVARPDADGNDAERLANERAALEHQYQDVKARLLREGTAGRLSPRRMATALEMLSALHRLIDQVTKAAQYLYRFEESFDRGGVAAEATDAEAA